jgi:glutamate---cysteine ligase / carboxylate-amine ligase
MVGFRAMLCGMHVHVEVPDPMRRIEIMYRTFPYLHLFLALSASSPFWQQHATGLASYRLAASQEMPRSGLPELFKSDTEYELYVKSLTEAGVIQDASYIWWIIRPSVSHPTIELRVADVCTRVEDALCVAALYRCLIRRLIRDPGLNARLDPVDQAIAKENLWRAQRWGTAATFIVREAQQARAQPIEAIVNDFIELLIEDAQALDCVQEVSSARDILVRGSSASTQLDQYRSARESGLGRGQALRGVVDWLQRSTIEQLANGGQGTPERTFP